MVKLEATCDCPFGVGVQSKGSQFEATENEAKILVALQRAKVVETKAAKTEEAKPVKVEESKGKHNRRDMRAKD